MKPILNHLRSKGFLYLDDFLLIDSSVEASLRNISVTLRLLKHLGFNVNHEKSCLRPNQTCTFLGFQYNSIRMTISLPPEKCQKMMKLISKFTSIKSCKIRDFAKFLGVLTSACPAIRYSWLYTKSFERCKYLALKESRNNYEEIMNLPTSLQSDFKWWLNNLPLSFNNIKVDTFVIEIFTDASSTGWGAVCGDSFTDGVWSSAERNHHINYLELLAAYFGLINFTKDLRDVNVLCRIDNTTAISYINRMGGVQFPKLTNLARTIWQWCENRGIFIFAYYIKSSENQKADYLSRLTTINTEWELNPLYFRKLVKEFSQPDIDLFASGRNNKCKHFVSWFPEPDAFCVDAFTLEWSGFFFYAFPHFALIPRLLKKIIEDRAEGIVVAPLWSSQPWYPLFVSLLKTKPIYFEPNIDLLHSPSRKHCYPLWKDITLVGGILSARHLEAGVCHQTQ